MRKLILFAGVTLVGFFIAKGIQHFIEEYDNELDETDDLEDEVGL
jgi:hypothetical protein